MKAQRQQTSTSPLDGITRRHKRRMGRAGRAGVSNMKSRVFVIEDHPLMRRSLVDAIERETDLTVCGQAKDALEAFAAVVSVQPDIVLTDIQLKSSSGLDFIKAIRAHSPGLPVVATTMFDVQRTERLARAAGASAFVAKQDGPGKLIEIVRNSLKKDKAPNEGGNAEGK
jgi:DNA-binding NarL/FixJ family response regulator